MLTPNRTRRVSALLCILALACIVLADAQPGPKPASLSDPNAKRDTHPRWRHPGGYDSDDDDDDHYYDSDDDGDDDENDYYGFRHGGGSGSGSGGQDGGRGTGTGADAAGVGLSFDPEKANGIRNAHGIVAAIIFVGVFPIGAMVLRLMSGRPWLHAGIQIVALAGFVAAAGLGIWLALYVRIPGQNGTVNLEKSVNFHPIIGLVVLAALLLQPIFGFLHHRAFKRTGGRGAWSHLHLWNGRLAIPLGMANGALGLWISNAGRAVLISYSVVAAAVWLVWMVFAIVSEVKRRKRVAGGGAGARGGGGAGNGVAMRKVVTPPERAGTEVSAVSERSRGSRGSPRSEVSRLSSHMEGSRRGSRRSSS